MSLVSNAVPHGKGGLVRKKSNFQGLRKTQRKLDGLKRFR